MRIRCKAAQRAAVVPVAIVVAGLSAGAAPPASIGTSPGPSGVIVAQSPSGLLALQAPAAQRGQRLRVYAPQKGQPFQDWTFEDLGTLRQLPASQRRQLGVTGSDLRRYGGDTVAYLQLSPGGQGTGLCLADRAGKAALAGCPHATATDPGLLLIEVPSNADEPAPGMWLLSLSQAPVPGHHQALYADAAGGRALFQQRTNTGAEIWAPWHSQSTLLPVVTSFTPEIVNDQAGNKIIITGRNFHGATAVYFETVYGTKIPVASFTVDSNTQITAYVAAANPPAYVPRFSYVVVARGTVASRRNAASSGFLQEDVQVDEVCTDPAHPVLILYSVPDNQGNPTNATLTDLSDNSVAPVSTNAPAQDGTPGWRESVPPMTGLPATGTQTFQIHDTTFNITWTTQITFGGPGNCGFTVFRG